MFLVAASVAIEALRMWSATAAGCDIATECEASTSIHESDAWL